MNIYTYMHMVIRRKCLSVFWIITRMVYPFLIRLIYIDVCIHTYSYKYVHLLVCVWNWGSMRCLSVFWITRKMERHSLIKLVYIDVYMYIHVCLYVYIYVYGNKEKLSIYLLNYKEVGTPFLTQIGFLRTCTYSCMCMIPSHEEISVVIISFLL
jgi:hypothetical protein